MKNKRDYALGAIGAAALWCAFAFTVGVGWLKVAAVLALVTAAIVLGAIRLRWWWQLDQLSPSDCDKVCGCWKSRLDR